MEPTEEFAIRDYIEIVRRRKWSLIITPVAVIAIATFVALSLPDVYRSTATILIEQQNIPSDLVMTSATGYAEQRIQTINKRIMSSSSLMEVINQFNLYADLKYTWTTDEILDKMRENVSLETISSDITNQRTGKASMVTTAFTISYEGEDPGKVQKVADKLTSMFLNENLKAGEQQAMETTEFFESEMGKVKANLAVKENLIAAFKEKNFNSLPDILESNIQSLYSAESSVDRLNEQLRSLKEKEGYLELQLSNTSRDLRNQDPDEQRLDELRIKLTNLTSNFSSEYPDVVKTRAEIAEIEKQIESKKVQNTTGTDTPGNPAFITLASQLASTRTDIESVKRQMAEYEARAADYKARIEATPRVEESYNSMKIERDNLQAKFDDLMSKMMEAQVAQGLQSEQKGERFTLIDQARIPEEPYKPNRLVIVLIGMVLGIGAGVGFASLREFTDDIIRSGQVLLRLSSSPTLAIIPCIVTDEDTNRRRVIRIFTLTATALAVVAIAVMVHTQVIDLGLFWTKVMETLG